MKWKEEKNEQPDILHNIHFLFQIAGFDPDVPPWIG
jgi:hypothetical protein